MQRYCFDYKETKPIEVNCIKNPCRYHKKDGKYFEINALTPENLCPEAFSTAYSYCLALLYNAQLDEICEHADDSIILRCPNPKEYIVMKVQSYERSKIFSGLKRFMVKSLHKIGLHTELPSKKIKMIIVDNVSCPAGYNTGEEFFFNISNKKEICPAGFSAIHPFLSLEGFFDIPCFNTEQKSRQIHCPDPRGVIYELK